MAIIEELWEIFDDQSYKAQTYFQNCTALAYEAATAIYANLGLPKQKFSTEIDATNKQVIVTMSFPIPDKIQMNTIDLQLLVHENEDRDDLVVEVERTGERITMEGLAKFIHPVLRWETKKMLGRHKENRLKNNVSTSQLRNP